MLENYRNNPRYKSFNTEDSVYSLPVWVDEDGFSWAISFSLERSFEAIEDYLMNNLSELSTDFLIEHYQKIQGKISFSKLLYSAIDDVKEVLPGSLDYMLLAMIRPENLKHMVEPFYDTYGLYPLMSDPGNQLLSYYELSEGMQHGLVYEYGLEADDLDSIVAIPIDWD